MQKIHLLLNCFYKLRQVISVSMQKQNVEGNGEQCFCTYQFQLQFERSLLLILISIDLLQKNIYSHCYSAHRAYLPRIICITWNQAKYCVVSWKIKNYFVHNPFMYYIIFFPFNISWSNIKTHLKRCYLFHKSKG